MIEDPGNPPDAGGSGDAGAETVKPESLTRRHPGYTAQPFAFSKHAIAVKGVALILDIDLKLRERPSVADEALVL